MTHSIQLDHNLGVVVLRYSGIVDFEEIRNVFDELVQIPSFREGLSLVADFRNSDTPLTADEVRKLANYALRTDGKWGATKWALIASKDRTFGLARMYLALTADYQVTTHVFRSAQDADNWLGLGVEMEEILARASPAGKT